MKRTYVVLPLITAALVAGCSLQLGASTPQKPKAESVKAQIVEFYAEADLLSERLEHATGGASAAVAKQNLDELPQHLKDQLLKIRAEAYTLHPQVQETRIWLSERIQLVSEGEQGQVTDDVFGLFTLSIPRADGTTGWLAQIVVNMETQNVVDHVVNRDLTQPFTPAFLKVLPKPGEPMLIRKVWDGEIKQNSLGQSGTIGTKTVELDEYGNVVQTLR